MPSDPASSPGLGAALKRLGVALVNATLMLVALILLLAVVLAVQLRGIAQDGRAELRSQIAGLEQQIAETRSTVSRALAELEAMRDTGRETGRASPGAIRPQAEAPLAETAALQAALDELVERLARLEHRPAAPSALPDAGHDLRPDNQTWIRWLALSFIRAVAREIIGPESGAGSGI